MIGKDLKVLEIIKEKEVQVCNLKHYIKTKKNAREHYNWVYEEYDYMQLTEEEYDLLKEVLCNETI